MRMRNPNPFSGLRQLVSGYLALPRVVIVQNFKVCESNLAQLGAFIVFLVSADWDSSPYRNGLIRCSLKDLATAWNLSESTLSRWKQALVKKGLLIETENGIKIARYKESFTLQSAQKIAKDGVTDAKLKELFPESVEGAAIPEYLPQEDDDSFRNSFKSEFNNEDVDPDDIPF